MNEASEELRPAVPTAARHSSANLATASKINEKCMTDRRSRKRPERAALKYLVAGVIT